MSLIEEQTVPFQQRLFVPDGCCLFSMTTATLDVWKHKQASAQSFLTREPGLLQGCCVAIYLILRVVYVPAGERRISDDSRCVWTEYRISRVVVL